MQKFSTSLLPINLNRTTALSISPYQRNVGFGANPWRTSGLRGGASCDCSPATGCGCTAPGFSGFRQGTSLDSIIQNAANWLGGYATSQLPTSAAVPPNYGSLGNFATSLGQYLPYIVVGYILYRTLK